jgi:flagellar assembly factor FliW
MKINTRDYGEIDINEDDILTFVEPIFGFEEYKKFIFLIEEDFEGQIAWLQSVDEPELCFIVANPNMVNFEYTPSIPEHIKESICKDGYEVWLMMVVHEELKESTVNLKSPLIINFEKKVAIQIILEDHYSVRFPIFELEKGGNELC